MPLDWTAFHAARVADTRTTALANACERVQQWLRVDPVEREATVTRDLDTGMEPTIAVEALRLVRRKLCRGATVDVDDAAASQRACEDVAMTRANDLPADRVGDVDVIDEIWPLVQGRASTESPGIAAQRMRLADATAAFVVVRERTDGMATPTGYEQLRQATSDLGRAGETLGPALARDHAWWMGHAHWRLGAVARDLGHFAAAVTALEQAAEHYDVAGESTSAEDCRDQARGIVHRLSADVDAATVDDVRALLTELPPLMRARALVRLASHVGGSGDRFESVRLAGEAGRLLHGLGYADPQTSYGDTPQELDETLQRWLDTATASRVGADLEAHLAEVTRHWAQILSSRTNAASGRDTAAADASDVVFRALTSFFPGELNRQATLATEGAAGRMAQWESTLAMPTTTDTAGTSETGFPIGDLHAFNDAMFALKERYEHGAEDSMLDAAAHLHAEAKRRGWRVQAADALIERARILFALGRYDEVAAAADAATLTLLDGRAPSLGSFDTSPERELYVRATLARSHGSAALKDWSGVLYSCAPLVREIEAERERVSDLFQRSAAMSSRVEVYELVAIAARHCADWDLLLDTTERLKARAALSTRIGASDAGQESPAYREWRAVNDALRTARPGDPDVVGLRDRRRWLSRLVAIERARTRGLPDTTSVAAIQEALGQDEVAVSWFWIQAVALFVQTVTRHSYEVTPIYLDDTQQAQLREFVAAASSAGQADPGDDAFFDRFDALIDALGAVLLPEVVRTRLAGCRRLILSPHRSLHLFPFHAVPWTDEDRSGRLIELSAVRYVPNLTSLLLPWGGSSEGRVLAVGVKHFDDPAYESLWDAEAEAAAVAGIHGGRGEFLRSPDRETFASRLAREPYRCLHLATHGSSVLHGDAVDDPRLSSLSLRDGDLSAWDLSTLGVSAELVVLAACHSGQRAVFGRGLDALPGDDLFGLQAVFFEAGAWGVLGTLWPVDDETAREIMTAFHRAYASGVPPEAALQQAMAQYLTNPEGSPSPFMWAPFVLVTLGRHPGTPAS